MKKTVLRYALAGLLTTKINERFEKVFKETVSTLTTVDHKSLKIDRKQSPYLTWSWIRLQTFDARFGKNEHCVLVDDTFVDY